MITGHGAEDVEAYLREVDPQVHCVRQMPQRGTGHAVQQAVPALPDEGVTLILNGDVPLIRSATAAALIQACQGRQLALLTLELADATGYGRIVRGADGQIQGIVEHKDATAEQHRIREVYTGVMAAPTRWLKQAVMGLNNHNAQGEFYLTDVVAQAVAAGLPVTSVTAADETEVLGVNSPAQLADLERRYQAQQAAALMEAGVRLRDPARLDVRGSLVCAQDVEIDINCIFEGHVQLGEGVRIGAHCVIRDAVIEAGLSSTPTPTSTAMDSPSAWARAHWWALMHACALAQTWVPRCTSATSWKSRTAVWTRAPRPTTWPTWATAPWASG